MLSKILKHIPGLGQLFKTREKPKGPPALQAIRPRSDAEWLELAQKRAADPNGRTRSLASYDENLIREKSGSDTPRHRYGSIRRQGDLPTDEKLSRTARRAFLSEDKIKELHTSRAAESATHRELFRQALARYDATLKPEPRVGKLEVA